MPRRADLAVHFALTDEGLRGPLACGAHQAQAAALDPAAVTCGNCKRRMPKPVEMVQFVATFHDNPNIDACPECGPAVALILDAHPDTEPSELELPHCDFCDDLRLVYVQRAAENSP